MSDNGVSPKKAEEEENYDDEEEDEDEDENGACIGVLNDI